MQRQSFQTPFEVEFLLIYCPFWLLKTKKDRLNVKRIYFYIGLHFRHQKTKRTLKLTYR